MSALRFVEGAPAGAVMLLAAFAAAAVGLVRRRSGRGAARPVSALLLVGCVAALAVMTTARGVPGSWAHANLVPGAGVLAAWRNPDPDVVLLNLAGNVVVFVPVGALATVAFATTWWRATLAGAALSVVVEVTQLAVGRVTDVDDVLLNTLGAALGASVAAAVPRLLRARRQRAASRTAAASVAATWSARRAGTLP